MSNISKDALMSVLPRVLADDAGMNPLGEMTAEALANSDTYAGFSALLTRIAELPEGALDILAQDLKIDWYEYDFEIERKRRVVAGAFMVHRKLGTAGALRRAMQDIWGSAIIEEWFEYGGDPYHFRVSVTDTYTAENEAEARKSIALTKNVRSVLDSITFNGGTSDATFYVMANVIAQTMRDSSTEIRD